MSRHSERKQLRRKSRRRIADKTSDAIMAIYERAKQGGSEDYLAINQPSEPERVAKIQAEAQERRDRRPQKSRQFVPTHRAVATPKNAPRGNYKRLASGQVVGHPEPMRTVKERARQSRLRRRAAFRKAKA